MSIEGFGYSAPSSTVDSLLKRYAVHIRRESTGVRLYGVWVATCVPVTRSLVRLCGSDSQG